MSATAFNLHGVRWTLSNAQLGQGTNGVVVAAEAEDGQRGAVKVVKHAFLSPRERECLRREVQILRFVSHPSIVPVHRAFSTTKATYVVMQRCDGGDVANLIGQAEMRGERGLGEARALGLGRDVADALAYLHKVHVVHGDVKAANVLVHAGRALLCDFGLALDLDCDPEKTGQRGTPAYMAPECISGQAAIARPRDVWAFGVLLFRMLFGAPPFASEEREELYDKIRANEWAFPADRPMDNETGARVVRRCLVASTHERAKMAEVVAVLSPTVAP